MFYNFIIKSDVVVLKSRSLSSTLAMHGKIRNYTEMAVVVKSCRIVGDEVSAYYVFGVQFVGSNCV